MLPFKDRKQRNHLCIIITLELSSIQYSHKSKCSFGICGRSGGQTLHRKHFHFHLSHQYSVKHTTKVIRLSNVYSLLSFYPSNSPLMHTEQPCSISAKAMQGSPHRGSAHSPLKSVQSDCNHTEGERAKDIKSIYKEVFCFGFLVIHLSCLRQKWFQGIGTIILKEH